MTIKIFNFIHHPTHLLTNHPVIIVHIAKNIANIELGTAINAKFVYKDMIIIVFGSVIVSENIIINSFIYFYLFKALTIGLK